MSLRRRNPFKFSSDEGEENVVLDEQEQEEVIQRLREENNKSSAQYSLAIQCIVCLSTLVHLIYLFNPTAEPLSALIPNQPSLGIDPQIPLPRPFTVISLALHLNAILLFDPTHVHFLLRRMQLGDNIEIHPLPYNLSYILSLVAPAVCFFLRKPWLTIGWWSITPAVIYAVQAVQEAITQGNENITALEAMKYTAPGA
ncbi:hypothetical protein Moror_11853 [Moniliophthora roreri MCA 2997]|nr:hypothetical protein Moror_11853 [Moniliophthora roreri MCA 2997]